MKLELASIFINEIKFSERTEVNENTLYINRSELISETTGGDARIKSVEVFLAQPGESVRIIPVKDVIEPR